MNLFIKNDLNKINNSYKRRIKNKIQITVKDKLNIK